MMPRTLLVFAAGLLPSIARAGLTSISIANPSFNADSFGGVGYASQNGGVVTGWNLTNPGGMGVTGVDQPGGAHFIDGVIIDGNRAGFIQGTGEYSQTLSGLTPGSRYVFQGMFRPRNCCGDSPVFSASFGGQPLVTNQLLTAGAPWQAFSVPFTATATSGSLSISSVTQAGGDGSLGLDNIQVLQINSDYANIFNASFESGTSYAFPGYQNAIGGWTADGNNGGFGYNHAGNSPFADNGLYPEGNTVAFIQNTRTLSQLLTGLTAGQLYLLEMDYNSRNDGDDGHIRVALGGTTLLDSIVTPVGGANPWYHLSAPWTAGGASASLDIGGIANGADSSIVFDNVTLRAIPEPSTAAVLLTGLTGLVLRRRRS